MKYTRIGANCLIIDPAAHKIFEGDDGHYYIVDRGTPDTCEDGPLQILQDRHIVHRRGQMASVPVKSMRSGCHYEVLVSVGVLVYLRQFLGMATHFKI